MMADIKETDENRVLSLDGRGENRLPMERKHESRSSTAEKFVQPLLQFYWPSDPSCGPENSNLRIIIDIK